MSDYRFEPPTAYDNQGNIMEGVVNPETGIITFPNPPTFIFATLPSQFARQPIDTAVARGIQEAAPFHEAYPVLREWLIKNGILLADGGNGWYAMDMRPGYEGISFPDRFLNLSQALAFALEHVKNHLQGGTK